MDGLRGRDKQQDDLVDAAHAQSPEGLKRKRVGAGETVRERNDETADQVTQEQPIPAPGEPAGGE